MKIIIGMGNPGQKYENTRHNAGFKVLDLFSEKNNFPEFSLAKKFKATASENIFNGEKILLLKPETFMNESGKTAKAVILNLKPKNEDLIIVNDDIDLPLGKIKISKNHGSAGHKGVESIIKETGSKDFCRIRIGIGKPELLNNIQESSPCDFCEMPCKKEKAANAVLKNFKKEEKELFKKSMENAVLALEKILQEGEEKAMNEFNQ